jgi:hypothetical protein
MTNEERSKIISEILDLLSQLGNVVEESATEHNPGALSGSRPTTN